MSTREGYRHRLPRDEAPQVTVRALRCGHEWTVTTVQRDGAKLTCPECGVGRRVRLAAGERRCPCGNLLARLNPGPDCFACQDASARVARARVLMAVRTDRAGSA